MQNDAIVTYFGQRMRVGCDRNCAKAWGINNRPKIEFSEDLDDYVFLADDELGDAPKDPGTYEGGQGKPSSPDDFPNKWCVRECERCAHSKVGEYEDDLLPIDLSKRHYNMPWLHLAP